MTETPSSHDSSDSTFDRRLLVVDGHSLAFRAYFALPADSFSTSDGQATNAIYGFTTMLAQVLRDEKPSHVAIAFDVKGGTFRNQMLPQYKGTRDAAPEDLLSQLPLIQEVLKALDISYVERQGFEGDDIIATLATMGEEAGFETFVLSGDRDAFQLVDDSITVLYPGHHFKDLQHMTPDAVFAKYKVTPGQYPDLAAMRGEQADNIPGVPGVGDGYAAKWIKEYGGLAGIVEHADEIGGKKGQALRDNIDQVLLNRKVNALVRNVDLGVSLDEFKLHQPKVDEVKDVFGRLQFGRNTQLRIITAMAVAEGADEKLAAAAYGPAPGRKKAASAGVPSSPAESAKATPLLPGQAEGFEEEVDLNPADVDLIQPDLVPLPPAPVFGAAKKEREEAWEKRLTAATDWITDLTRAPSSSQTGRKKQTDQARRNDHDLSFFLHARGRVEKGASRLQSLTIMTAEGHSLILHHDDFDFYRQGSGLLIEALDQLLRQESDHIVLHDFKRWLHLTSNLRNQGQPLGGPDFLPVADTKLEAYLAQPDATAKVDGLRHYAQKFLHLDVGETKEKTSEQGAFDLGLESDEETGENSAPSPEPADPRQEEKEREETDCALDCAYLKALHDLFHPVLASRGQINLLKTIELPVSRVLSAMEMTGAGVDQSRLEQMRESFSAQAEQAQQIAWQEAGKEINLQSPKQLQAVLFDDMGLTPTKKTKSGGRTTNAAALQELYMRSIHNERANAFLGALLRHREVNKLKQIVQTLIDAIDVRDSRIHTTFEQTVAATGRLSSTDPNLQNIPNRNVEGREIRGAFVASDGFESLLSSDYSQVELRLMAHLSGDEALIEAFRSGADFHKYVASLVYGIPIDQISSDQRSHIKAMSYGLAYGLSTYGLAQQLGISPAEADILRAKYFSTFGKVHDYLESLVAQAKKRGYTETMFGRRRYFPDLRSSRRQLRDAAERAALNAPIQGSAADIMKIAMKKAYQDLKDAGVKSRIILQIHDELVVELAPGEQEQVTAMVKEAMEHAVKLAVPLDVSTGVGSDWQLAAH